MVSALDTAQYILESHGPVTTMKLQKLVYYSQAWSIVWEDDIIFPDDIEAWKNGPVVRDLWERTRGKFKIENLDAANSDELTPENKATIDRVMSFYGNKDAQWLSDLTHMEEPWKEAFARGQNSTISLELMSEYYSSIPPIDVQKGS